MGRVAGNLYLAYRALVVWPLKSLLPRGGVSRFWENYATEGLIPTSPEDREVLAAASRCISCGLCDAFDGSLGRLGPGYEGVSLLPRQVARSSADLPLAAPLLRRLDPASYREAESVCPTGVPLVRIAHWLRDRAERVEAAREA